MKKVQMSISNIFWGIGTGFLFTVLLLSGVVFLTTKSITGVAICMITGGILSVWLFALVTILQKRLAVFTNDICHTIDDMMQDEYTARMIFDQDTMLDRINHQLNRLFQMLQSGKRMIEEQRMDLQGMISDISHQIKTPAANLKMMISFLSEQEVSRKQQVEYLQSMNIQLDKLDFLMSAMVKSSRLETGVIVLEKQQVAIYETLATALGSIFLKAEEKQLQVKIDCPEKLIVPHDPKWTAEALFNVLENAVKYTPIGGGIQIKVSRWEAYTKIDISDTGRGITESRQSAIFQRFYREPEVHNIEGIGIGLYLTREIISKQGGRIKVTSASGKGAAFTIFLPND